MELRRSGFLKCFPSEALDFLPKFTIGAHSICELSTGLQKYQWHLL